MNNRPVTRSELLFQRALKVLPGGASRNAVLRKPVPCYTERARGCVVTDIDGKQRIDFANNMASLIHGHAHPAVIEAVMRQLPRGTAYNFATEVEIDFAEHMVARSEGFEKIRFVNSGTEAVMCALKAARAYTQRPKIAKTEGAYHGTYDYAEISQTAGPPTWGSESRPESVPVARGTPQGVLDDVIVIPFNDTERAIEILDRHRGELACVLVDPLPHRVCMRPADPGFIAALYRWTRSDGSLLVYDEVITFRTHHGGAQQSYPERPDLTALGKIIGGGFPVGAVAGREDVMDVFDPGKPVVLIPHSGTFSANPVTMTAGLAAMKLYDKAAVAHVNRLGERARKLLAEAIRHADVPACVTGGGSMFRIHMKPLPPLNYRESFPTPAEARMLNSLVSHAFDNGIILIGTGSGTISTPMATVEIDRMAEVVHSGLMKLRASRPVTAGAV